MSQEAAVNRISYQVNAYIELEANHAIEIMDSHAIDDEIACQIEDGLLIEEAAV